MRNVILLGCAMAALAATAAGAGSAPDVTKGEINGRVALIAMPVASVESTPQGPRAGALLSAEGCETHLAPIDDLETDLVFPCGKWFQPAPGPYRIWLERPAQISEGYGLLQWDDAPFTGRGMSMVMPMEPAGRIALRTPLAANQSFRFVHLRAVTKNMLRPAFDRRVRGDAAAKGAAVATGSVLAGIFDRATDDAIALARPVQVKEGQVSYVAPAPPQTGTDVFVVMARPRPGRLGQDEVRPTLRTAGGTRAPDVFLASASTIFAVWYGVAGGEATLRVESETLHLPPTPMKLLTGKVVTLRTTLQKRPDIKVSFLGATERLEDEQLKLELRSAPEKDLIATRPASVDREEVFVGVSRRAYDVVLAIGDEWALRRRVDVSAGADEHVWFELDPIVVSGTVYHGRDPAPGATVAFQTGRGWTKASADENGLYEMLFWQRGEYIAEVEVSGRHGPPLLDGPFDLRQSRTVDFHVPNTRFVVSVVDARSGAPISGAKVIAGSVYERDTGEGRSAQIATANERGEAVLPPMREGTMTVRARAEGYVESAPTAYTVTRPDEEQSFEIRLQPEETAVAVAILGAGGAPAGEVRVWAVRTPGGQNAPLWNGTTDADGTIRIPERIRNAWFLVRAQNAAPAVRRLSGAETETWTLSPAAPITLRAPRRSRIAVWIDGVRVSGLPLSLVTSGMETTDVDGAWSAALPARPLRVLAWRTASLEAVDAGTYDAAATTLPFPWPRVVDVQPVD